MELGAWPVAILAVSRRVVQKLVKLRKNVPRYGEHGGASVHDRPAAALAERHARVAHAQRLHRDHPLAQLRLHHLIPGQLPVQPLVVIAPEGDLALFFPIIVLR
eukprot:CAMPEP_0179078798 /NCGR_PEP_ID=MMETSP0796-20121207/35315_1 /TAXON_ID=73915 /ORGANISM="Pyrodinium bahamense, Strain pbaha01" /LENGTH=103 /DNA_ID=CAMNT_0020776119 /DNA_START=331 /DNA_END=642 /DNA_ORIENTATION=+